MRPATYARIVAPILLVTAGAACATEFINKTSAPVADKDGNRSSVLQKAGTLKYPSDLRKRYIEGLVIVSYEVSQSGRTQNIHVTFSDPEQLFDKSAVETVSDWKFLPKLDHGQPVVSTRNDVMTFCVNDRNPRPLEQRFQPCRSDADKHAYLMEHLKPKQPNAAAAPDTLNTQPETP